MADSLEELIMKQKYGQAGPQEKAEPSPKQESDPERPYIALLEGLNTRLRENKRVKMTLSEANYQKLTAISAVHFNSSRGGFSNMVLDFIVSAYFEQHRQEVDRILELYKQKIGCDSSQ